MGDLEALETVLGQVGGENFAETHINPNIDAACADLSHYGWWVSDIIRAAGTRLATLTATDPTQFTEPIQQFSAASLMLGTSRMGPGIESSPADIPADKVAEHVQKARAVVEGTGTGSPPWTGQAAIAFGDDFAKLYTEGGQAVEAQRWMFNALQLIAEAHQAVYVRTRDDAIRLMQLLVNAADGLKHGLIPATLNGKEKLVLTVVAAVASVALTALNPPAGIAVAVPLISATASAVSGIVGAVPEQQATEMDIVGSSSDGLANSFDAAVTRLETEQQDRLDRIKTVLAGLADTLGGGDLRELMDGPEINDGDIPVHYDDNGNAVVDDDYLDGFNPPPH